MGHSSSVGALGSSVDAANEDMDLKVHLIESWCAKGKSKKSPVSPLFHARHIYRMSCVPTSYIKHLLSLIKAGFLASDQTLAAQSKVLVTKPLPCGASS